MPYSAALNAAAVVMPGVCAGCEEPFTALACVPLEERSLRSVSQLSAESLHDNDVRCELCGAKLTTTEAVYEFDEPGTPPLIVDTETGALTVTDVVVESEQDVVEHAGRPFSVADWHRLHLTPLREGMILYEVGPGIAVCASAVREPPQITADPNHPMGYDIPGQAERVRAMTDAVARKVGLLGGSGREISASGWVLQPWFLGLRDSVELWLGEPAERMVDGQLMVFALIDSARCVDAIQQEAELADLRWIPDEDPEQDESVGWVADRQDARMRIAFDAKTIGEDSTVHALTLREAAIRAVWQMQKTVRCARAVAQRLTTDGETVSWKDDLTLVVERSGEASRTRREVQLISAAHKCGLDPEDTADHVADVVRGMDDVFAQPDAGLHPCGCKPLLTAHMRPAGWGDDVTELPGTVAISRPFNDGADLVIATDCEHHAAFPMRGSPGFEEEDVLWRLARSSVPNIHWRVAARNVGGIMICGGYNLASTLWDVRSLRGMANAVGMKAERLVAVAINTNLVLLAPPNQSSDTLRMQVNRAIQDSQDQSWGRGLPLPPSPTRFRARGVKAGKWQVESF